jgi:hypothetical protein
MTINHDFIPNGPRAKLIDAKMRLQLANSLDYLHQSLCLQIDHEVPGLENLIDKMRKGGNYPPSTFGLYYEITSALIDGELDLAMSMFEELLIEAEYVSPEVEVITLGQLSKKSNIARYQRLMDTDPTIPFHIESLPDDIEAQSIHHFRSSLNRFKKALPELANEFEGLVRSLILVKGDSHTDYQFAGGSSYMLWGALFINAEIHPTEIAAIEAFAHESAHSLLFGFSIDEPLVLNNDDELYSSPLRYDPRPMDGIYHATFVSARMYWAMTELLASGELSNDEIAFVKEAQKRDRDNFYSGYSTVSEHARLTDTGRAIMKNAFDFMNLSSKS